MKAIIFDCDGTLVDTEKFHYQAWLLALKRHGVDFSIEEYSPCVGYPSDKASQLLVGKVGKNCAAELKTDKNSFYRSLINEGVTPIEDTLAFLHQLVKEQKRFGYKLAIASGAPLADINYYMNHLNIGHFFEVILSGKDDLNHYDDPEGVNKPKPYIYLEAAKRLGLDAKECIAIEDSEVGVTASSSAGCFTVAIPTAFSRYQNFSAANLILSSLKNYSVSQFLLDASKKRS